MIRFSQILYPCILGTTLLFILTGLVPASSIDFNNLSLVANSYWNGSSGAGSFTSGGATFNNDYNSSWGTWSGWSYSNVTDKTTAGWANQYSAITGGGVGGSGSIYGVGTSFSPNDAYINLPVGSKATSLSVTNSTYAYFSMLSGDSFAKKFGGTSGNDPDFFFLTVTGYSEAGATGTSTGSVDFYLADYRSANNAQDYILNSWSNIDLTSLGANTASLGFSMTSSDVGIYGMNTPAYFILGSAQLVTVPEPGAFVLASVWIATLVAVRCNRKKKRRI